MGVTDEMTEVWTTLGHTEREIVLMIAKRILGGQVQYGKLDLPSDARDFAQEMREEVWDALVYVACLAATKKKAA